MAQASIIYMNVKQIRPLRRSFFFVQFARAAHNGERPYYHTAPICEFFAYKSGLSYAHLISQNSGLLPTSYARIRVTNMSAHLTNKKIYDIILKKGIF